MPAAARRGTGWATTLLAALLGASLVSFGQEEGCVRCHARLLEGKYVHGAMRTRCAACHDAIDSTAVPHRSAGPGRKAMTLEAPAVCMRCHERKLFEGPVPHAPAAAGLCLVCHDAHASPYVAMLKKPPAALCLECHPDVAKSPHVTAGVARASHPLGGDSLKPEPPADPLRPGRPFYCASCHEPHRSSIAFLLRMPKGMPACLKCHRI